MVAINIKGLAKVCEEYADKRQKNEESEISSKASYTLDDLYGDNGVPPANKGSAIPSITENSGTDKTEEEDQPEIRAEEEFIPIGARGKVQWKIAITAVTTDAEINSQGPGSLTNAVIQVKKLINKKIQDMNSTLAPNTLAKKARDILVQWLESKPAAKPCQKSILVPNPAYQIIFTQQNPGVSVTPEEQKLADSGDLEYTFQVELNIKNGKTDLTLFQEFVQKVLKFDDKLTFLPWGSTDNDGLPEINIRHSPYSLIRGAVFLCHYLEPYNRNRY